MHAKQRPNHPVLPFVPANIVVENVKQDQRMHLPANTLNWPEKGGGEIWALSAQVQLTHINLLDTALGVEA